eukprot:TRINITY_DN4368_c0_g1_i3.p1 TRINITY_DN4368_c0_g1~~TRINITY_DN4368_c0_g1_i3.p1  ORF type:complete len:342 (-),score=66.92 TRINITY_DN4368_c0_g1_i3:93-1118(-)
MCIRDSLSAPLKRVSTPSLKTSESMEGIADTLNNSTDSAKTFQQVVSVWKDKDRLSSSPRGRPRSVQMATSNDGSDSSDNDSSNPRRERGLTGGSKIDPRARRRNVIEDSVSDWFGGENWKEEKKDKKKEKKEEKNLVKDMGKKLEQEIAKRQKLTQLLEGHKNTVSLLIEQKNQLEEKLFALQKLIQDKNLKKLVAEILEVEMDEIEFRTLVESQLTVPNETSENNWRLPGTRCMVRAEYDIWQEAVILGIAPTITTTASSKGDVSPLVPHLGSSTSGQSTQPININNSNGSIIAANNSSHCPLLPTPMYRIIVIGRLPAIEEIFPATDLKPIPKEDICS